MYPHRKKQNTEAIQQPQVKLDDTGILDMPFLILVVLLVAIGVVMIFSASYARAYFNTGNSAHYFVRQAIFAVADADADRNAGDQDYSQDRNRCHYLFFVKYAIILRVFHS